MPFWNHCNYPFQLLDGNNVTDQQDQEKMRLALRFARRGCGATSPNPNGIPSISPGLRGTRYPGSIVPNIFLPQRGCIAVLRATIQLL
jgi:hypothetical protein